MRGREVQQCLGEAIGSWLEVHRSRQKEHVI